MNLLRISVIIAFMTLAAAAFAPAHAQQPANLPLPAVPDTMREPAQRAAFIIEHFWDEMDFADTSRSMNDAFMESHFSTFASVFPHAGEDARRRAVGRLMGAAQTDAEAYFKLAGIAEKYLYESDSPVMSEENYILFLESIVSSPLAGDYRALRYRFQLEAARKNRPGMTAADFAYVTRDGRSRMLRLTPVKGSLLLIFYDPECEHCKEVMESLRNDRTIASAVAGGRLSVLALYADDNRALWERTADSLPSEWSVGYVTSDIIETQRYVLRSMPTLYLLDADKRVILKEASPADIAGMFGR